MIKNKKTGPNLANNKIGRSRSRSLSPQSSKVKLAPKASQRNVPKTSRDKLKNKKSKLNPSLGKSQSKRSLDRSISAKQGKRNSLQPRIGSSPSKQVIGKKNSMQQQKPLLAQHQGKQSKNDAKTMLNQKNGGIEAKQVRTQQPYNTPMRSQEKDLGLVLLKPQFDKVVFKALEITDPVFDKYLDMINNDNDAHYVMNALPELNTYKKEDQTEARDFVSGRISRLSGIFDNLSVDKIITPIKKVPHYYNGPCGKNLVYLRIMLQTKFKVQVDLGFLQFSLDGDKLTIFRIYVSKIYRKMNYVGFVYLQALKALMQRHPGADRWSIFILEKNMPVHKFFKFMGFHIDKIASQSKNKVVDYFQQFSLKRKELNTVLASMSK